MIDGDVGYINISQFSGNDVEGFDEAVSALQAAGVAGVVIDVRGNPGGLLTDVVEIADRLLPEGRIAYVEDGHGNRTEYASDADYWDVPLVVLADDMSASASELFSAAIQDFDRGEIVGVRTYGKGIVQTLIEFAGDGAGMQLTTASYYSPNGRSIHENGVEPDVYVERARRSTRRFRSPTSKTTPSSPPRWRRCGRASARDESETPFAAPPRPQSARRSRPARRRTGIPARRRSAFQAGSTASCVNRTCVSARNRGPRHERPDAGEGLAAVVRLPENAVRATNGRL